MKALRITILLLVLLSFIPAHLHSAQKEVTAVILRDLQPSSFEDPDTGNPAGFAVDIMNAVASRYGIKVRYLIVNNWQEAEEALQNGKADLCPVMVPTPERSHYLNFTDFIETSGVNIVVRSKSSEISRLADLEGRQVGVLRASQAQKLLKANARINLTQFDTFQVAIMELLSGRIDAYVGPDNIIRKLARETGLEDEIKILAPPLIEIKRAIAVAKANEKIFSLVKQPTSEFVSSPEYRALYAKWYGSPTPYWNTRRVSIAISAVILLSILILAIWRYRIMRERIAERTRSEALIQEKAQLLEIEVLERKAKEVELEKKNAELERFAYTVSHDLKSPLITIRGFAGALLKDVEKGRQDRLSTDLHRIMDAADKMSLLLNDLLELSRIGRIVNPPAVVSMQNIVKEALNSLSAAIAERKVELIVQPDLPDLFVDRLRIVEVVQNLVENSIKYMGDQQHPRIDIGIRDDGAFYVRDNGIGIEACYLETIFGLFNKLDGKSEGTGIGLALVRRIIDFHGGRVWAESDGPGHGTTMLFTLPEPPETKS